MASFLELTNRALSLLRFPRIASVVGAASPVTEVGELLNRALHAVLEEHNWSFLVRQTQLGIHANVSGTANGNVDTARLVIPETTVAIADLVNDQTRWHVRITSDGALGSTAIPIATATTAIGFHTLTFDQAVSAMTANVAASWTLYGDIGALSATVGRVLHVYHQERPLRLVFGDRYDLRRFEPDWSSFASDPDVMLVGGTTLPTRSSAGALADYRTQFIVWPPPAAAVVLDLDYFYRFADLALDADELGGVPESVQDLLPVYAAAEGFKSAVANDPARGKLLEVDYERNLARSLAADKPAPLERFIPTPFGSRRLGDPWRSWSARNPVGPYSGGPWIA